MSALADSPLGRAAKYPERYDPGAAVRRSSARPQRALLGFGGALPFGGVDLWTAYELSWLDPAGKPQVAIATFAVPADSPRLVESKSVKLYLTGFNLTRFDDASDVAASARARSRRTPSARAVEVTLTAAARKRSAAATPSFPARASMRCRSPSTHYEPAARSIDRHRSGAQRGAVHAALPLGVPGDGTARLRVRADRLSRARRSIARDLLRYLVSFRRHPGFHEHCVERIFADVWRRCRPETLSVYARFTRRGGIDINPYRSTEAAASPPAHVRTARQ